MTEVKETITETENVQRTEERRLHLCSRRKMAREAVVSNEGEL